MKLSYCPACARVYNLPEDAVYLCGRNHATSVWKDGNKRRFTISEQTTSNQPPRPIPALVEEVEMFREDFVESWLKECVNPGDSRFSDYRRHFSLGTLVGGTSLARKPSTSTGITSSSRLHREVQFSEGLPKPTISVTLGFPSSPFSIGSPNRY